jgi:8-oxo-dGTP diphosphatase
MELLKEFMRRPGIHLDGRTIHRETIKGIILRENCLFMVHSGRNGDYKFPGGGVNAGETHEQALKREIREECGALLSEFGQAFGKVIEYDRALEPGFDVFKMTSFYYFCQVDDTLRCEQSLEQYEKDLQMRPAWIDIDEAIRVNRAILSNRKSCECRWLPREVFILEQIKQRQIQGHHVEQF